MVMPDCVLHIIYRTIIMLEDQCDHSGHMHICRPLLCPCHTHHNAGYEDSTRQVVALESRHLHDGKIMRIDQVCTDSYFNVVLKV